MVRRKSSGVEGQDRSRIAWDQPPFCWLDRPQQTRINEQLEVLEYTIGEKIWESEGGGDRAILPP